MNKLLFWIYIICCPLLTVAQQQPLQVLTSYQEALTAARKNNKLIFIDFYTTWCGPCKTMDKEVFTDGAVSTYMNENFLTVKIDAEKGEGIALAKQYKVRAYPTFVVLDGQEVEKFRFSGAQPAKEFLETLAKNLDPTRQPAALAQRYEKGERTPALINDYVLEIMRSGDEKKGFEIVNDYFGKLSADEKTDPANLFLYQRYALDINDVKTKYLIAHKEAFAKRIGAEQANALVYRFVRSALIPYANGYYVKENKYDEATYLSLKKTLAEVALPDSLGIGALLKIADAQVTAQPSVIMDAYVSEFPKITKSDRFLMMLRMGAFKDDRVLADRAKALITAYISESEGNSVDMLRRILFELEEKGPSINFQQLSYQEALSKAKSEGKLVFIDCFTDWCGPCKWLDENTFRDPGIVKYFDANFINLKIDMEKGEGIALFKKFGVTSFPTMLFINGEGTILHKVAGALPAEKLMKEATAVQ
ncbi:thioredoxin fold domain-containing protein [Sphingobacterium paucimobilis]|uniref:thioredoxin fold domain-containing protein n=1 Tax=Sphingobacterium paucimobilis TaxID=1385985 RepID=UPI0004282FEB|nr:thioredoxin fold domain-containing protein [Sphingobacterium paucimobilis]